MLPVLRLIEGGAQNVSECVPKIKAEFGITDEEAEEIIPSGSMTVLQSRTHWARTYLAKAGLLASPKRNHHVITEVGRRFLATNPAFISTKTLDQFEGFKDWRTQGGPGDARTGSPAVYPAINESQTPQDAMEAADAMLTSALRDDLLSLLQEITPQRFERLILDLLSAMGYGGGDIANGHMTKASGDGGIDGIVNEDSLGLDAVYIQAKKYAPENRISRPDIQKFVGSLTGEGATKGVFVTTSDFSKDARQYVDKVQHRIVLINGTMLAKLMIDHGVGVRTRTTYIVRSVDEDYFSGICSKAL